MYLFKKIIFKLYHLFRFLSIFLFFFSFSIISYADTEPDISCSTSINNVKQSNFIDGLYKPFDYSPSDIGYISISYNGLIKINSSSTYTFAFASQPVSSSPRRIAIAYYDEDFNYISYTNQKASSNGELIYYRTFVTLSNASYITLHLYNITSSNANNNPYVFYTGYYPYNGISTPITLYEQCPPPTPPTPVVPPAGSVYSSFLNLYFDRYNFLATNFTTNPYLLAMLGVIFAFIVLELFLHIFHLKGGFKK